MYDLYIVRRTQIYLDERQDQQLEDRARACGRTKSALIREAVNAYLAPHSDDAAALARLRAAVAKAAGAAPGLPRGADYVESLRALEQDRDRAHRRQR